MKTSILCRKCLVKAICSQKCERIDSVIKFYNIIIVPFVFTCMIIGCIGLLVLAVFPELYQYRHVIEPFIMITELISFIILFVGLKVVATLNERF